MLFLSLPSTYAACDHFLDQQAVLTEGTVSALIYFTVPYYEPNQGIFSHILSPLSNEFCPSERFSLKRKPVKYYTVQIQRITLSYVLSEHQWL